MKKLLFFLSLALMLVVSNNVNAQLGGGVPTKNANLKFTNSSNQRVSVTFAISTPLYAPVWNKTVVVNVNQVYSETVKVNSGSYILGLSVTGELSGLLTQQTQNFNVHNSTFLVMDFQNYRVVFDPYALAY